MKKYLSWFTVIFAVLGFCLSMYLMLGLDTFSWDEAHHAYFGNLIYHDLRSLNIPQFFSDTGRQGWFQPFHSYIDAFFMLLLGRSYFSVRFSSTFLYLLLFYAIYKMSLLVSKEKGPYISAIASFLLASSPNMLVMSSLNMQEMSGACIAMFMIIFYVSKKDDYLGNLLIGAILSAAFLTKYQFGFLFGGAIFLIELSKVLDVPSKIEGLKVFVINNCLIFAGFVPLTALWFLTPDSQRKIGLFFFRMKDAQGWNRGFNMLQRIAFYTQSILTEYSMSVLIGTFLIISIFYSFRYLKDIKVRSLLALVLVFLVFHAITPAIFERLILPAMPALFILAGITAVDMFMLMPSLLRGPSAAAIAVLLLGNLLYLPQYSKQVSNYSFGTLMYKQNVQDISPREFFGTIKLPLSLVPFNPSVDKFPRFTAEPRGKLRDVLDFFSSGSEKGKPVATLISMFDISPYEIYWHFDGWGAPVMTINDYNVVGKNFWFAQYYFALEVADSSPYKGEIIEDPKHWSDVSAPFIARGWLKLYASKDFPELGLKAKIYKMKLPF